MAGLAFVLTIGVVWWPPLVDPLRWALLAAGIPLLSRIDLRTVSPAALWLLAGTLAYATLSIVWTPDRLTGLYDLSHLIILAGIFVAAAELDDISGIMTAATWGISISAVVTVTQLFGWISIPNTVSPGGLFLNRDYLAEAAAPLFIWNTLSGRYLTAGVMAIPLGLCGSRVAMIAALVGLPAKLRWPPLIAIAIFTLDPGKIASLHDRIVIWKETIRQITPFGHGIGWFITTYWFHSDPPRWAYAHSDGLQTLAELGWVPIFGGACGVAYILFRRNNWRITARDSSKHHHILAISAAKQADGGSAAARGALAGLGVEVLIAHPLHLPVSGFLLAVLAGTLARRRDRLCVDESLLQSRDDATDRAEPALAAGHQ